MGADPYDAEAPGVGARRAAPRGRAQPWAARARGSTADAPAERIAAAATVSVQPVATWSSTSRTVAPAGTSASSPPRRRTAATRCAELDWPARGGTEASRIAQE